MYTSSKRKAFRYASCPSHRAMKYARRHGKSIITAWHRRSPKLRRLFKRHSR